MNDLEKFKKARWFTAKITAALAFYSFIAIQGMTPVALPNSIYTDWDPIDYWLAWTSGLSLLGVCVGAIIMIMLTVWIFDEEQ